ncbi:MAG: hypothetical protein AAGN35_03955 [Bacteroidota bacterium]
MPQALNQNYDLFTEMLTILEEDKTRFYRVGDQEPYAINRAEILTNPSHVNYAFNIDNFGTNASLLRQAVSLAVRDMDQESLFITDFELIEPRGEVTRPNCNGINESTPIDVSNWAVSPFAKWLAAGHSIDVFSAPFRQEGYNKKANTSVSQDQFLFFLFFTPRGRSNSMIAKCFERGLVRGDVAHLNFGTQEYKLRKDYGNKSAQEKGLGSEIEFEEYFENEGFEYYQVLRSDLVTSLEYEEFSAERKLLEGLTLESKMQCFATPQLDIKVTDITKTYAQLLETYINQEELPEKIETDGVAVDELFQLKDREGKISVHVSNPGLIPPRSSFYQIEISLVGEPAELPDANMRKYLTWKDKIFSSCMPVNSLYGSLKEAMSRTQLPQDRIFTYYLELID